MNKTMHFYQHEDPLLLEAVDEVIIRIARGRKDPQMKSILLCGSDPGVGTTTIAINLAIALAKGQWRTLLIDGDLRKKKEHKRAGERVEAGLGDYIEDKSSFNDIIYPTNHANLTFIPSGNPPVHSLRLVTKGLDKLLEFMGETYDFIIFDSPSLEAVNDALAVSRYVDGALLVAELGYTSRNSLYRMAEELGESCRILGVVVNKVTRQEFRSYMKQFDYFQKEKYIKQKGKAIPILQEPAGSGHTRQPEKEKAVQASGKRGRQG